MGDFFKKISVVIPVYNEEGSLSSLFEEIVQVMEGMGIEYEIVVVDDGSFDGSWDVIKDLARRYSVVKGIKLGRNFGQTSALSAGIAEAGGDLIITMDGDGQNDPLDIPGLVEKIKEGYDLVSGWRRERKDSYIRRVLPSRIANWMIGLFTGLKLKDFGCTLKVYRADIIKGIHLYGEMHRMIPALAFWGGAKVAELEVNHRPRASGESKYDISRIFNVFFDLITLKFFVGYFRRPLHFFGTAGLFLFFFGIASYLAMIFMKVLHNVDMTGNPFLILGTVFLILGMQLMALGLLGEIGVRTYYETQNKPTYIIREKIGF